MVDENPGYLVSDAAGRDLARLLFGAAAWRCAPRDRALGWNDEERCRDLPRLANNTRFLVLPWVRRSRPLLQTIAPNNGLCGGRRSPQDAAGLPVLRPVWGLRAVVDHANTATMKSRRAATCPVPSRNHLTTVALLATTLASSVVQAEDADRFRPYLRFHSGDISPLWGVDDMWSFSLGANFNRYLGAELTLDFFETDFEYSSYGTLGEVSAWNTVPYFRLRYPTLKDRLVPYVLAGIGPSFLQFNDRRPNLGGKEIDIEGMTFAVGAGVGLEYFIADNVTFGIEGKYIWINPIDGTVDGQNVNVDISSAAFTFGLRVYFDENEPRMLATEEEEKPNQFYFGWRVGGFVMTDSDWTSGVSWVPDAAAKGDISQNGALALGANFGENWGVELTADSIEPGIALEGEGTIGEYGMGAVLANLRLRHPLGRGRWVPYAMVGGGITYAEWNDAKPGSVGLDVDAKGIYPAVGVGAGIEYFVVRNFSLNADARWLYTWDHEIDITSVASGRGDFSALQFNIGFRVYLFDF